MAVAVVAVADGAWLIQSHGRVVHAVLSRHCRHCLWLRDSGQFSRMTACSLFVYLYLLDQNWKLLVTRDDTLEPCSSFFLQCNKALQCM